jgi:hypothetical protein
MFKKTKPQMNMIEFISRPFPHCDQRILHGPGECRYCDANKEWQALRLAWGIAFTGWEPEYKELPCPADYARGDAHKLWPENRATEEPCQTV